MTDKRKMKDLAEAILKKQGIPYDEWLHQKHMEVVAENSDIVMSALNGKKE